MKHSTVDYVFRYDPSHLYVYHLLVIKNMNERGYGVDPSWYDRMYRGKKLEKYRTLQEAGTFVMSASWDGIIYREHDDRYLLECLLNLKSKGARLENGRQSKNFSSTSTQRAYTVRNQPEK